MALDDDKALRKMFHTLGTYDVISQQIVPDNATDWPSTHGAGHSTMLQSFRADVAAHLVASVSVNDARLFRSGETNHAHAARLRYIVSGRICIGQRGRP